MAAQLSIQWENSASRTQTLDRLLHNQCLKCDYDQMCAQIVSEAEDFVISHRCMLLEQSFMSCHQRKSAHHRISAIWQKDFWTYSMMQKGMIPAETVISAATCVYVYNKGICCKNANSGTQSQQWNWCTVISKKKTITKHKCACSKSTDDSGEHR